METTTVTPSMEDLLVPGLTFRLLGETEQVRCDECGATGLWSLNRGSIRHSRRCDSKPQLRASAEAPVVSKDRFAPALNRTEREAIRSGCAGAVFSDREIAGLVATKFISEADAMNRDD